MTAALILWALLGPPGELERLVGHTTATVPGGLRILDIAGEGPPLLGVVQYADAKLWLRANDGRRYQLIGPLARPRIAGPGYRVWVIGTVIEAPSGPELRLRRIGVLAPPWAPAGPQPTKVVPARSSENPPQ